MTPPRSFGSSRRSATPSWPFGVDAFSPQQVIAATEDTRDTISILARSSAAPCSR